MNVTEVEKAFIEAKRLAQRLYEGRDETPIGGVFLDVYALTQACLINDANDESVSYLVGEIQGLVDRYSDMLPQLIQVGAEPQSLACKKGCTYCCSIRVTTNPPEALAIAASVRDRKGLIAKLKAYEAQSTPLSPDDRLFQVLECAFLDGGLCSIYSFRPNSCRTYHSFDVARCIADHADPRAMIGVPQDPVRREIGDAIYEGMEEACISLGLEFNVLEFVPALILALEEPNIAQRWLNGERVFGPAHNADLIVLSQRATDRMNSLDSE